MNNRMFALALFGAVATAASAAATPVGGDPARWIAVWASSPSFRAKRLAEGEQTSFTDQSVRQDIRVGAATNRIRLRLTNELGDGPISIVGISVAALRSDGHLGRPIAVTLGGRPGATMPADTVLLSDPVALPLKVGGDIAVSVHYGATSSPVAHRADLHVAPGAAMPPTDGPYIRAPGIVSAVEAAEPAGRAPTVIVAFGDSITEGAHSTPHRHRDWPSVLAAKLQAAAPGRFVVDNAGIGGNKLLDDGGSPAGVGRFDRDVLALPGVRYVILLEGINDIHAWVGEGIKTGGDGDVAQRLIAAYRQIVTRAHAHGIKVIGATLTPDQSKYLVTDGQPYIETVNRFIRSSALFDGVVDFNKAIADPGDPRRMAAQFDSGDHLHPNDAGYAAMAAAIPANLFTTRH